MARTFHDQQREERPGFLLGILNGICKVYTTVIRGTPMMVQLLIMAFVVFKSSRNLVGVAALAFGINSGAYVAEIIRGGLMSVDAGQMEAGRSLGLNYIQTMRHIIIPQAVKNILPALGNELITLLKETSIVTVIGLRDLTKAAVVEGAHHGHQQAQRHAQHQGQHRHLQGVAHALQIHLPPALLNEGLIEILIQFRPGPQGASSLGLDQQLFAPRGPTHAVTHLSFSPRRGGPQDWPPLPDLFSYQSAGRSGQRRSHRHPGGYHRLHLLLRHRGERRLRRGTRHGL